MLEAYGVTWRDEEWPKGTKMPKIEIPDNVKEQILADLKK